MSRSRARSAAMRFAMTAGLLLTVSADLMAQELAVSTMFEAGAPEATPVGSIFTAAPIAVFEPAESPTKPAPAPVLSGLADLPPLDISTRAAAPELQASRRDSPSDRFLVPLYASFLALQALDVHSTLRATRLGAFESNPALAPFTDRPTAFVAIKAGTAAGIVYMTERVRRDHPLAATLMMAAFNSVYATVVANNYRIGNRLAR